MLGTIGQFPVKHLAAKFRQQRGQVDVIVAAVVGAAIATGDRVFPIDIEAVKNAGRAAGAARAIGKR